MKKAVFITSRQMPENYHRLCSNDFGKVLNTRDNDIPKTDGLLTVMKRFDTDGDIKSAVLRITSLGNTVIKRRLFAPKLKSPIKMAQLELLLPMKVGTQRS